MDKIKSFLKSQTSRQDYTLCSLTLLSASAVLRREKEIREILLILKKKKFNKTKMYEALLQTYLFAGYPSALIALSIYTEIFDLSEKLKEEWDISLFRERGEKNCRKIYGDKYEKLISNINSFSPELSDWLVTEGYGKVFGRKGLSLKEREICNIAVLSALKFESQLYSHINGGHRLGLTWKEINTVIKSISLFNRNDCVKLGEKVLYSLMKRKEEKLILPPKTKT